MIKLVKVKAIIRKKDIAELTYVKSDRDVFETASEIKVIGNGVCEKYDLDKYDWTPADFWLLVGVGVDHTVQHGILSFDYYGTISIGHWGWNFYFGPEQIIDRLLE